MEKNEKEVSNSYTGDVTNELIELYKEAQQNGFVVQEYGGGPTGGYLACLYVQVELDSLGITEIDELTGIDYQLEHSWPGGGKTREEAVGRALNSWKEWLKGVNDRLRSSQEFQL